MKRIIVTNNKKVADKLGNRAEISYNSKSALDVLKEARTLAEKGGRVMTDPGRTSAKSYYRSIPILLDGETADPKSMELLDKVIAEAQKNAAAFEKEPALSGIMQNKDLELVKKIVG